MKGLPHSLSASLFLVLSIWEAGDWIRSMIFNKSNGLSFSIRSSYARDYTKVVRSERIYFHIPILHESLPKKNRGRWAGLRVSKYIQLFCFSRYIYSFGVLFYIRNRYVSFLELMYKGLSRPTFRKGLRQRQKPNFNIYWNNQFKQDFDGII